MITKGIYLLYRVLLSAASPIFLFYFLSRAARKPAYFGTLRERLGFLPRSYRETPGGAIWLHAVSVGEVLSSMELLKRLRAELPDSPLFVSTTTLAGRAIADEKLAPLVDGVFYAPIDFAFAVRRVLRALRPNVVIVAETEIWPNLFRETKRAGCGLLIVNGRISDRTAPRYFALRWFFRHVLRWPDAIFVESDRLRDRYIRAGAPPGRVEVGGNLKYDVQPGPPSTPVTVFLDRVRPDHVWIAASTMPPDEDDTIIDAFRRLAPKHSGLLLLLAPRKPERFDLAADKLRDAGIPFVRRSMLADSETVALPGALLLDSMGELSGLFSRADVVFMGGSIVTWGGHNILEPAVFSKPIVVGPYMQNFQDMADSFRSAGAMVEVDDAAGLSGAIAALLDDPDRAAGIGERGRQCAEVKRGATRRAVEAVARLYDEAVPDFRPPLAILLWPVQRLWFLAVAAKRALDTARRGRLKAPVVSVGNLSMGGTGKTPLVLYLAAALPGPAILTRGYRRESSERSLLFGPGDTATAAKTGDEAQLFLRSGLAAVGIGADRLATGRLLEQKYPVRTILLDDGFQHWRVDRHVDVVLIDALDPFPYLRLREPLAALGRAHVFVITRASRAKPGIEARLRRHNPNAPIFHAEIIPECWIDGATGLPATPQARAIAFCGLANPAAFWRTLASMGIHPIEKIRFPDHARYQPADLAPLRSRADALLTTEKDFVKLDPSTRRRVYWLKIRLEIDREQEFLQTIRAML